MKIVYKVIDLFIFSSEIVSLLSSMLHTSSQGRVGSSGCRNLFVDLLLLNPSTFESRFGLYCLSLKCLILR